jgi:hypothetical protein
MGPLAPSAPSHLLMLSFLQVRCVTFFRIRKREAGDSGGDVCGTWQASSVSFFIQQGGNGKWMRLRGELAGARNQRERRGYRRASRAELACRYAPIHQRNSGQLR